MGQSPSIHEPTRPTHNPTRCRSFATRLTSFNKSKPPSTSSSPPSDLTTQSYDATSYLPDECLAHVFQSLPTTDRKRCSLVCKRWLQVEGQTRHRISLIATVDILPVLPSLFTRFDSVTKLALRCDRRSISVPDDALILISLHCKNLKRLKLRGCRELTDAGVAAFARNCKSLKKLSCGSCVFGVKGLNSILHHCTLLEEISIKRLRGINRDNEPPLAEQIGQSITAKSLKTICLKELYNGQLFGPLIAGAENLKTLKLIRCLGDWDRVFEMLGNNSSIVQIHLERIQVSDGGLKSISSCVNLDVLHLVKTPDCSNLGIVSVADRCKSLRKVHIDGWRTNRVGDLGLIALGMNCPNLQELVLIGINPTISSLEVIATNCKGLERLALCSSDTIGDVELSCIASKCVALKKFCIKSCPISDIGMEALAWGCPNLVKIKVKKCRDVTAKVVEWLKGKREGLVVNLDSDEIEPVDASASEAGGWQDETVVFENMVTAVQAPGGGSGAGALPMLRTKLNLLFGKNVVVCALRRWSAGGVSTNSDQ